MKIKCLLVMPGKEVQKLKIPASLKFIKAFIGENLLKIRVSENTIIYANQDAPNDEFNRIYQNYIIFGTFIVVSLKNSKRVSMKRRELRRYTNMFKLSKHKKKIERYKDEFLEEYYVSQRNIKEKSKEINKKLLFKDVA
ncbi:MAG: hypothetical protein UIT70_01385 [Clostridia bacterium]|jgi:hypothetical protein|nr:hypothetical protein [Clostridia bacterium]